MCYQSINPVRASFMPVDCYRKIYGILQEMKSLIQPYLYKEQ